MKRILGLVTSGGVGFTSILLIVFIVLKLTHNIDWSWWWVLSPFWLPWSVIIIIFLVVVLLFIFGCILYA